MKSLKTTLAIAFGLISLWISAQNKDSLLLSLKTEKSDSILVQTNLQLARIFYNDSTDTSSFYYSKAIGLSKSNNLSESISHLCELSNFYRDRYNYKNAIRYAKEANTISLGLYDSTSIARSFNELGNIYLQMDLFKEALENLLNALKFIKPDKDPKEAGRLYGRIGNLYLAMGTDYNAARDYYQKAIKYFEQSGTIQGVIIATQNLGIIEKRTKNYPKAIEYYNSALNSYEKINNQVGIAHCMANLGNIEYEKGNLTNALNYQLGALKIYESRKMYNDIILNCTEIATTYNKLLKPRESIKYLNKATEFNKAYGGDSRSLLLIYHTYRDAYLLLGDTIKAYKYLDKYQILNDTILYKDSQDKIDQLRIQFNITQFEKDNRLLTAENELKAAEIKRKTIFQILYLILIGFSLVTLTILYFLLKTKQRSNRLLTLKNAEILQQKEEIESQRDEIEAQKEEIEAQRDDLEVQRSIAVNQRDKIVLQKQHITDSITYAKHLQTALLPNDSEINETIKSGFIYFNPLDIVSGDFYWVSNKHTMPIVAVADCTGHGVPGAMMSVLGLNFLNNIVDERGITDPGQVLTILNEQVINALSHADGHFQDKDGMDISLCSIDTNKMIITYACARNRILIWRNGEIIQLEADKYSIGKSPFIDKMVYRTFTFPIENNDMIYLMTDGYVDQFGGPKRTKYLASRFKENLKNIGALEPNLQKETLEKNIAEWMGDTIQIDDMLIFGIKV